MKPLKKNDPKCCRKCKNHLTDDNWKIYLQKKKNYICSSCSSILTQKYHRQDTKYSDKQLSRIRNHKSAVIFAYGDKCHSCHEDDFNKLLISQPGKHKGNLYEWLYNHQVQDGYKISCYNCNASFNNLDKCALNNKLKVILFYGGACSLCSEQQLEKLTIKRKMEESRGSLPFGSKLYRYIIKNNFPDNYYVICFNCYYSIIPRKILEFNGS